MNQLLEAGSTPQWVKFGVILHAKDLGFTRLKRLLQAFEPLNPWRKTLKTPFLRLEKENFDANGHRKLLNFYGISAKLAIHDLQKKDVKN